MGPISKCDKFPTSAKYFRPTGLTFSGLKPTEHLRSINPLDSPLQFVHELNWSTLDAAASLIHQIY